MKNIYVDRIEKLEKKIVSFDNCIRMQLLLNEALIAQIKADKISISNLDNAIMDLEDCLEDIEKWNNIKNLDKPEFSGASGRFNA